MASQLTLNLNSDANGKSLVTVVIPMSAMLPLVASEFFDFMPTNRQWKGSFRYSFGHKVCPPDELLRGVALVASHAHNVKVVGSIPTPVTISLFQENRVVAKSRE